MNKQTMNAAADVLVDAVRELIEMIKDGEKRKKDIPREIARQYYSTRERNELQLFTINEPVLDAFLQAY